MPPDEQTQGFILPLAVLLVVLLTISGTAFMHHDYLERRMAGNTADNHGAFYLANAGLERARETFKIPPDGTWTTVLNGLDPAYPEDPAPVFCKLCLCGEDPSSGCVVPSFGALVDSGIPFDAQFAAGQYEVRAFNNEPSLTDTDQILAVRARGTIRGELKLLEAHLLATTGLGLVNCQGAAGSACPDDVNANAALDNIDGRDPRPIATLPSFDPAFYRDAANFPWTAATLSCGAGITCSGSTITIDAQDGSFYLIEGLADPEQTTVVIDASGNTRDIAVFSEAPIEVQGDDHFTNIVMTSLRDVQLQGNVTLRAPETPVMYPAIVSGGNVGGDASVNVFGNIYASGPIDFRPIKVHGLLIGTDVSLQSAATRITDDGAPAYYGVMPGVTYPPELLTAVVTAGTWRELQ